MYKIRGILDTKEDVIRTLLVEDNVNLESLHNSISKAFGFEGQEMASFYKTDDEWNQGEEIPLFNMSEAGDGIFMKNCFIKSAIQTSGDKLIYVYDFLKMWTFYVEVIEVTADNQDNLPKTILSVGQIPTEAPEKEFIAEQSNHDFEDDYGSDFNNDFESLDDIDFDQY